MKTSIDASTTSGDLSSILALAVSAGATHAHVLRKKGRRAVVCPIDDVVGNFFGQEATVSFGTKERGMPFVHLDDTVIKTPAPTKDDTLAPTPKPAASKPKEAKVRPNSGFIALIDRLLLTKGGTEKVEGFHRSKYTVEDAVKIILKYFPEKNAVSVKKVVKVRPRHLEMIKGADAYDGNKNRAPRWAWVGPGGNGIKAVAALAAKKAKEQTVAKVRKPKAKTTKITNAEKRKRYAA